MNAHHLLVFGLFTTAHIAQAQTQEVCTAASRSATIMGLTPNCNGDFYSFWRPLIERGTREQLRSALRNCYYRSELFKSVTGWVFHNSPRAELQEVGRELIYSSWNAISDQRVLSETDAQNLIEPWAHNEVLMSPAYLELVDHNFATMLKPTYDNEIDMARDASSKLCLYMGSLSDCKSAVNELLDLMDPRTLRVTGRDTDSQAVVSLIAPLQRFAKSSFDRMVAARVAVRIFQRSNEAPSEVDFFKDVQNVYSQALIEKGLSASQAQSEAFEKTWDFMGLYATRGMSWFVLAGLLPQESNITLLIMTEVGRLLAKTDTLWVASGHPYSYPAELKMNCYHGRPYHFWMSAYFAHHLNTHQNYARWYAYAASFMPGLFYEIGTKTWGRDPMAPFRTDYDSGYNQGIRQNLVLKKLGAKWGTDSPKELWKPKQPWVFEDLFDSQYYSGKPVHLTREQIDELKDNPTEWFFRFDELFNPFHNFRDYYYYGRRRPQN